MRAIIMAAGQSTRTYPLTLTRPKPLLPILNRPILEHQLDAMPEAVDTVVLVVGYRADQIKARFGARYGRLALEYVEQAEQRGTGHAILLCADRIRGPFLAMNGDDLYAPGDLARLVAHGPSAALAKTVDDPRRFGIYDVTADRKVIRLVEKPAEVFSYLANTGAYLFAPDAFEVLRHTAPSPRGEIEITCAIQTLAERGEFRVVEAESYWLSIGYPWHLLDANAFFLETALRVENHGEVHPAAHITGAVHIGRGTIVRPGVVIEGPACIGDECDLGPNCWIRPGTTLGNHCRVGQGSEIKNSILFDRAKAPHLNYVGDSVIGENANLGCGTVTANLRHDNKNVRSPINGVLVDTGRRKLGAILADGVHTGINTSIYPGRKLWPNVGTRPGQVVDRDIAD